MYTNKSIKCIGKEDYILEKCIGKGTYSQVYRTSKGNALKILAIDLFDGCSIPLVREVELSSIMKHKNIIPIDDISFGRFGIRQFVMIEMKLCKQNLGQLISSSFLTEDIITKIAFQLLDVVSYMHENDIAHRDIKPQNIMVDEDLNIYLIDFNLAKKLRSNYHSPNMVGTSEIVTVCYRPPEIDGKNCTYDAKAVDMWSIGCVIAEMITNEPLFFSREWCEVRKKQEDFFENKHFNKELINKSKFAYLINSLLKKCPSARLTAKEALNLDIFREFDREDIQPQTPENKKVYCENNLPEHIHDFIFNMCETFYENEENLFEKIKSLAEKIACRYINTYSKSMNEEEMDILATASFTLATKSMNDRYIRIVEILDPEYIETKRVIDKEIDILQKLFFRLSI